MLRNTANRRNWTGRHGVTCPADRQNGRVAAFPVAMTTILVGDHALSDRLLGAIIQRYAPQALGGSPPTGPIPAPDTFPPTLSAYIARPNWRKLWITLLLAQIGLVAGVSLWWNGGFSVRTLATNMYRTERIAFANEGGTLFAVGSNVQLWHLPEGKLSSTVDGIPGFSEAALSSDGTLLALGGWRSSASLWRITNGKATLRYLFMEERKDSLAPSVSSIAFAPDNQTVAIGMENGTLRLWSALDDHVRQTLQDNGDNNQVQLRGSLTYGYNLDRAVGGVTFAPNGDRLAFYNWKSGVKLCQLATSSCVRVGRDDYGVYSLAFSPDGKTLAVGKSDGTVDLYSVADQRRLDTLQGLHSAVDSLAFASNGAVLASGARNGAIDLWRMSDHSRARRLRGHGGGISALAFSPDNRSLASGADDRTIRLWDISDLQ